MVNHARNETHTTARFWSSENRGKRFVSDETATRTLRGDAVKGFFLINQLHSGGLFAAINLSQVVSFSETDNGGSLTIHLTDGRAIKTCGSIRCVGDLINEALASEKEVPPCAE